MKQQLPEEDLSDPQNTPAIPHSEPAAGTATIEAAMEAWTGQETGRGQTVLYYYCAGNHRRHASQLHWYQSHLGLVLDSRH